MAKLRVVICVEECAVMRFLQSLRRLLAVLGLIVLPAATAQAGLFDFFGQPEPQPLMIERPALSGLPPVLSPLPRHPVEIHRHITVVRKTSIDKTIAFDHLSAALKRDATLREGDAVMTRHGIRIFAGPSSGEHRANEFAKLEEVKGLSRPEQTALAEIDKRNANIKPARAGDVLTGRSSTANSSIAWKWLRDPKGRLIRYVGP